MSIYFKGLVQNYPWTVNTRCPDNFVEDQLEGGPQGGNTMYPFYDMFSVKYKKPFAVRSCPAQIPLLFFYSNDFFFRFQKQEVAFIYILKHWGHCHQELVICKLPNPIGESNNFYCIGILQTEYFLFARYLTRPSFYQNFPKVKMISELVTPLY